MARRSQGCFMKWPDFQSMCVSYFDCRLNCSLSHRSQVLGRSARWNNSCIARDVQGPGGKAVQHMTGKGGASNSFISSCCSKMKLALTPCLKHFQINLRRNELPFLSIQPQLYTGYTAWHNILPEIRAAERTSILHTGPVPEIALQTTAFS